MTGLLILVVAVIAGKYFLKDILLSQDVKSVSKGSMVFVKYSGYNGSQSPQTNYIAYRIEEIKGDTIFAAPINTVKELPYSIIGKEDYDQLLKEGRKAKINEIPTSRKYFEVENTSPKKAEEMFPILKTSAFYTYKNETEKFVKLDFYNGKMLIRWTNEATAGNNFTNKYYPASGGQDISDFVR